MRLYNSSEKQWHHVSICYFVFIRNKPNIYELVKVIIMGKGMLLFLACFVPLTGHNKFSY